MKTTHLSARQALLVAISILTVTLSACRPFARETPIKGPAPTHSTTAVLTHATGTALPGVTEAATPTQALPTATATEPAATATPSPAAQPLTVVEQWFARTGPDRLNYAFMVENPNRDLALAGSRYHVFALDEAGTQVGMTGGTIDLVPPGERLVVASGGSMAVSAEAQVSRLELEIEPGEATASETIKNPLTAGQSEFVPGGTYDSHVSVVVKNALASPVRDAQVVALAFDARGAFLSSGVERVDLIPAQGQAAVVIRLETGQEPARIDLYPSLLDLSVLAEAPQGLEAFRLDGSWFGQEGITVHFAFVFENPNPSLAFEGSIYQVAAYDAAGKVLGTYSHFLPITFPGQRLGVAGFMTLLKEAPVSKVDVQISPGESKASELSGSPFASEGVAFSHDAVHSKVTGIVTNSLDKDVETVWLAAIAYDEKGAIIGGGEGRLDFVPANGQIAASVDIQATGEPASVELYPRLHEYSKLKEASGEGNTLNVVATGFLRDNNTGKVVVAFIVENSGETLTFLNTACQVAAYDAAGTVLGTSACDIPAVFPGERLGRVADLLAPEEATVASVQVQLHVGESTASELARNPFTAEQVEYVPDPHGYFPQVTGLVKSAWSKDTSITLAAIAYDESGSIMGGGFANGFAEAHGQGTVSFYVATTGQQPAKVELYPSFQSFTDLLP